MNLHFLLEDLKLYFQARIQDLQDFIDYEVLGRRPQKPSYFPQKVKILWRFSPETRTFSAIWEDHPEYFAVADTAEDIITNMNDLICEHFGVPRYLIRKAGKKNFFKPKKGVYKKMLSLEQDKKKIRVFEQKTNFQHTFTPAFT